MTAGRCCSAPVRPGTLSAATIAYTDSANLEAPRPHSGSVQAEEQFFFEQPLWVMGLPTIWQAKKERGGNPTVSRSGGLSCYSDVVCLIGIRGATRPD